MQVNPGTSPAPLFRPGHTPEPPPQSPPSVVSDRLQLSRDYHERQSPTADAEVETVPPKPVTVEVAAGDSLSAIAERHLGDPSRWPEVFEFNRDQLEDPDLIHPGMVLKLPLSNLLAPDPVVPAQEAAATPPQAPAPAEALSPEAKQQMQGLMEAAIAGSGGKRALGWCYREVWGYIQQQGYGKMPAVDIPGEYSRFARHFADFANQGDNAAMLGIKRLPIDNPYEAPAGAIVVVRAGTPGTSHPEAGDIAVAAGDGRFLNDGEMGYGGPEHFPPGNDYVLGIYVPA